MVAKHMCFCHYGYAHLGKFQAADNVKLQEVSILKDAPKRNPVQELWQNAVYTFNEGNYDGYQYDRR